MIRVESEVVNVLFTAQDHNRKLLTDLKQRGLLDETLVVWCGEFGRSPDNGIRQGGVVYGRDHNAKAMAVWFAGGYPWEVNVKLTASLIVVQDLLPSSLSAGFFCSAAATI